MKILWPIDKRIEEVLNELSVDHTGVNHEAVAETKAKLDDLYREKFDKVGR